jgi:hypothetical protein
MESQYTVHTRPRALTTGQGRKRLAVAAFAAAASAAGAPWLRWRCSPAAYPISNFAATGFHPKRDLIKPRNFGFQFFQQYNLELTIRVGSLYSEPVS